MDFILQNVWGNNLRTKTDFVAPPCGGKCELQQQRTRDNQKTRTLFCLGPC